jgi:hypothetical protein
MPNLSIKDVPEAWAEALRQRAARNHRSLQGELMAILESAIREQSVFDPPPPFKQGHMTVEELAAEMRLAGARPVAGQPLAVDILRELRDQR